MTVSKKGYAQVAARIGLGEERFLRKMFRTKSAGGEFVVSWGVLGLRRGVAALFKEFDMPELEKLVRAFQDFRPTKDVATARYAAFRIRDDIVLPEEDREHLAAKAERLSEMQAAGLVVLTSAFWRSPESEGKSIGEYLSDVKAFLSSGGEEGA